MAMIDYGCLIIKNGVLINEDEFFQEMRDAVGWSDDNLTQEARDMNGVKIDGNFFGYIGDEHLTVCFYKQRCLFVLDQKTVFEYWGNQKYIFNGNGEAVRAPEQAFGVSKRFTFDGHSVHIKDMTDGCGQVYLLTMRYKGDSYRVIYGYGIDPQLRVWNRVKREYLPASWKKIDNELFRVKEKAR